MAWSLCGVAIALMAAGLVLFVLNGFDSGADWGTGAVSLFLFVPTLAFSMTGVLIAMRQPGNRIGWICLAVGLGMAMIVFASSYALYGTETAPGSVPAASYVAWLGNWDYVIPVGLLGIFLPLLFPSGQLVSPRWRYLAWLGVVTIVLGGLADALQPGPLYDNPSISNPFGLEGDETLRSILAIGFPLLPLCFVASAASVVTRFRRAGPTERQQLKWFAFAAAMLAVIFAFTVLIEEIVSMGDGEFAGGALEDVVSLAFAGLPIATGVAILRHRLYDIDVVINRTLVYGALTATLLASYLGSVLLLQLLLQPLTADSGLAIAGSTLGVAALFRPARNRIQELVDRRFFRRRYDAARTLESFGARLRDEVSLDSLSGELREVVSETMQPAHVSLWLRAPDGAGP